MPTGPSEPQLVPVHRSAPLPPHCRECVTAWGVDLRPVLPMDTLDAAGPR